MVVFGDYCGSQLLFLLLELFLLLLELLALVGLLRQLQRDLLLALFQIRDVGLLFDSILLLLYQLFRSLIQGSLCLFELGIHLFLVLFQASLTGVFILNLL